MEFVNSKDDIILNMNTLDQYLVSEMSQENEFARSLIRRGHCFIADDSTGTWRFYPSRFIGYANNSMEAHKANMEKDGRETNPIIKGILNQKDEPNDKLDVAYVDYCSEINIEPSKINRRFWCLDSLDEKQRASVRRGIARISKKQETEFIDALDRELEELGIEGEDRVALTKVRVNQGLFRDKLLRRYNQCCLCGVQDEHLLKASHIKPWSVCEKTEKLDVDNGFLFCPNHDYLFDKGYISFSDNGQILISDSLSDQDSVFMNVNEDMRIAISDGNRRYLECHRKLYGF